MTFEYDAVETVARLMALSARTAPKARGTDVIRTTIATGDDLVLLARAMREFGEKRNASFFIRDAGNIEASDACLIVGALLADTVGLDGGGAGGPTRAQ